MLRVATMGHQLAAATAHLVVEIPANGRLAPWLHTFFIVIQKPSMICSLTLSWSIKFGTGK
jgi:hypothetical protein